MGIDKAIEKLKDRINNISNINPCTKRAPLNEWEVVYLLGRIAESANFTLIEGSESFPDCTIGIELNGALVKIRTELEYKSSNFNHDVNGCELVICWEKDCHLPIPIIELKNIFTDLPQTKEFSKIDFVTKNNNLSQIFLEIEETLKDCNLVASNTGVLSETNTHAFYLGDQTLCALQFCGQDTNEFVRFRIYKAFAELLEAKIYELILNIKCNRNETATAINFDFYKEHAPLDKQARSIIKTTISQLMKTHEGLIKT